MERRFESTLPVLGFNFLQAKPVVSPTGRVAKADTSPIFTYTPVNALVRAQEMNDEFVVFRASTERKEGPQDGQAIDAYEINSFRKKSSYRVTIQSSSFLQKAYHSPFQLQEL